MFDAVMQPIGTQDMLSGGTYNPGGGVIYIPLTGTTSDAGAPDRPSNLGYNVGGVGVPIRRVQR